MDLYQQFETDETAEAEGVWVTIGIGARLKIARAGNPKHAAAIKRLSAPHIRPGMRMADIPDDVFSTITKEAVAESILVDWEGITRNGVPVPYSKAEALAACGLKDFYNLVLTTSQSIEHYRKARIQELEKN